MNSSCTLHCKECENGDFLRHKHTRHPAVCLCEHCGKTFTRVGDMKRHQRNIHAKAVRFTCPCGRAFTRKESLKCHYMRKHLQVLNIEALCPTINKGCFHHHNRNSSNNYQCAECISGDVLRHKHTKHPAVCVCEECGKTFTSHAYMRIHQRTIHEKSESYACDQCGLFFLSKRSLHSHYMGVHLQAIKPETLSTCSVSQERRNPTVETSFNIKNNIEESSYIKNEDNNGVDRTKYPILLKHLTEETPIMNQHRTIHSRCNNNIRCDIFF